MAIDPDPLGRDQVDQFGLWTFPVAFNLRKRLLGDGEMPAGLNLDKSESTESVIVLNFMVKQKLNRRNASREPGHTALPRFARYSDAVLLLRQRKVFRDDAHQIRRIYGLGNKIDHAGF